MRLFWFFGQLKLPATQLMCQCAEHSLTVLDQILEGNHNSRHHLVNGKVLMQVMLEIFNQGNEGQALL
tara:strand:- start:7471 stop:7674 length:204 start_codon:yes stop_codon:yes gene_type:complete